MQVRNVRYHCTTVWVTSTGVRKIAGLKHVPTCTACVRYTKPYLHSHMYGVSSARETKTVGLDIGAIQSVKFSVVDTGNHSVCIRDILPKS